VALSRTPAKRSRVPTRPVEKSPVPADEYQLHNKFLLVVLAVHRSRQLHNGARPRVEPEGHKSNWIAAREAAAGRVSWTVAEKPVAAAPGA
jgi:DNA-directed RNA polymerase omega subunit